MDSLVRDPSNATLPARSSVLVALADKLTREPYAVVEPDVDALRAHGLTDRGIHDAVSIIAYYNYVNRLAAGLGVEI